jgi:acylphosphatase
VVRAKRYVVRGQVQGVGYRYFAQRVADGLGVKGYVRHAEANDQTLHLFKQELERGPRMSQVTGITETEVSPGVYSSFLIRG